MNHIVLENDGSYKKCIIIDGKSYVLMDYDDKLSIKGNTLKGRGNEAFVNKFISNCIDYIFAEDLSKIRDEYDYWYERIENKQMSIDEVCKRESINMTLETYQNKISAGQSQIATYEAALQADKHYQKGDTIVTWVEEPEPVLKEYKTREDEWKIPTNVPSYETIRLASNFNGNIYRNHYHGRLETAVKRFMIIFGVDGWQIWFPFLSILKSDKYKLIAPLGLEKFHQHYFNFGWNQKSYDKLTEKDKELFASLVNNGYLSEEYKTLTTK